MRLAAAIAATPIQATSQFDPQLEVTAVVVDSRQVHPGHIFVAVPGFQCDGAQYIPAAIERGARVIVTERIPPVLAAGVTYLQVENARMALATIARELSGRPDEQLTMLAVTGTNGKTTVAQYVRGVCRAAGRKVGVLGTLGFQYDGGVVSTSNTTPEASVLYPLLRQAVELGLDTVVMEVSSHAIELHRVDGITFDVAMFTNLTPDHLEIHGTMERYYATKARLFEPKRARRCVIAIDDEWGQRLAQSREAPGMVVRVSTLGLDTDVTGDCLSATLEGTDARVTVAGVSRDVHLRGIGRFNSCNAAVAAGCGFALGIDAETIFAGLEATEPVVGRMEPVPNDEGLAVLVDSAHTPDALAKSLAELRRLSGKPVTLVHGVLSDRNPELLVELERVAAAGADHIVFTESDMKVGNFEDVLRIVTPVLDEGPASWELVPNRWQAIGVGVERARAGDVVVISGKGDERQMYLPGGAGTVPIHEPEVAVYAIRGGDPLDLDPRRAS